MSATTPKEIKVFCWRFTSQEELDAEEFECTTSDIHLCVVHPYDLIGWMMDILASGKAGKFELKVSELPKEKPFRTEGDDYNFQFQLFSYKKLIFKVYESEFGNIYSPKWVWTSFIEFIGNDTIALTLRVDEISSLIHALLNVHQNPYLFTHKISLCNQTLFAKTKTTEKVNIYFWMTSGENDREGAPFFI